MIKHPALRRPPRLAAAAVLAGSAALACAADFDYGGYHVTVTADDSGIMTTTDYQITVANDDLVLSRLTAPYEGTLSNSFVADLDGDGGFEVVVTFSREAGRRTGIDVYTWKHDRLEPVPVAAVDPARAPGYHGSDEVAVSGGKLLRIYQVYEQIDGAWRPTAAQRRLRYSFTDARWVADR